MSIVIATQIDIDATLRQVWDVLTYFRSYAEWSNSSKIDGEPGLGAGPGMRMPIMSFGSTVAGAIPEIGYGEQAAQKSPNII